MEKWIPICNTCVSFARSLADSTLDPYIINLYLHWPSDRCQNCVYSHTAHTHTRIHIWRAAICFSSVHVRRIRISADTTQQPASLPAVTRVNPSEYICVCVCIFVSKAIKTLPFEFEIVCTNGGAWRQKMKNPSEKFSVLALRKGSIANKSTTIKWKFIHFCCLTKVVRKRKWFLPPTDRPDWVGMRTTFSVCVRVYIHLLVPSAIWLGWMVLGEVSMRI